MPQRYFVATPLPSHCIDALHALCVQITGHTSPVRFHHITLVSPFTLLDEHDLQRCIDAVRTYTFPSFSAHISHLGTFHQLDRTLLVAHVEPHDVLGQHASHLNQTLSPYIQLDTTPYTDGVVPAFDAHTTLDYNTMLIVPESSLSTYDVGNIQWDIHSLKMYKEVEQGKWETVE